MKSIFNTFSQLYLCTVYIYTWKSSANITSKKSILLDFSKPVQFSTVLWKLQIQQWLVNLLRDSKPSCHYLEINHEISHWPTTLYGLMVDWILCVSTSCSRQIVGDFPSLVKPLGEVLHPISFGAKVPSGWVAHTSPKLLWVMAVISFLYYTILKALMEKKGTPLEIPSELVW